jgi:hypothetical protein
MQALQLEVELGQEMDRGYEGELLYAFVELVAEGQLR